MTLILSFFFTTVFVYTVLYRGKDKQELAQEHKQEKDRVEQALDKNLEQVELLNERLSNILNNK